MVGSLEQKDEFKLSPLVAKAGEVEQPRDSLARSSSQPAWTDPSDSTPRPSTIQYCTRDLIRDLLFFRDVAVVKERLIIYYDVCSIAELSCIHG